MRSRAVRKVIMERMVDVSGANDGWDIEFWQRCNANSRFASAWQMIKDFYKIRGKNGVKPRLRRDVEKFKRI
jgi:hypothetical protein